MYEILKFSENFDSLNKIKTTSSESKGKLGRSGKGLVTALTLKTKSRSKKYKKGKVCHRKCQNEGPFQYYQRVWKVVKVPYVKSIPKHEPTSIYHHLVGCITECMLRCGEDSQHVHDGYTEETALSSNVNDMDEDESKELILHEPCWCCGGWFECTLIRNTQLIQ